MLAKARTENFHVLCPFLFVFVFSYCFITGLPSKGAFFAGNARRKVLAYPSLAFIPTIHSGEVDFAQFPM